MDESIEEPLTLSIEEPLTLSIEEPLTVSIEEPLTLSIEEPLTPTVAEEPLDLSEIEQEDLEQITERAVPLATNTTCKKRSFGEVEDLSIPATLTTTNSIKKIAADSVKQQCAKLLSRSARPDTDTSSLSLVAVRDETSNARDTEGTRSTMDSEGINHKHSPQFTTFTGKRFFFLNCYDDEVEKAIEKAGGKAEIFYDIHRVTDVVVRNIQSAKLDKGSRKVILLQKIP